MTQSDKTAFDPFKDIALDAFKKEPKPQTAQPLHPNRLADKEAIKAIAQESNFQSREVPAAAEPKPKIVTKTFSLFQQDCAILNEGLKVYLDAPDEGGSQPSGSDIVRAALHAFHQLPDDEKRALIKQHRGRGRR